jgi:hypothetical protein
MRRSIVISSALVIGVFSAMFVTGVPFGLAQQTPAAPSQPGTALPGKYVDKDGSIHLPEDYRLKWVHLGSWYDEDAKGGPGGMHDVYAEPDAVAAFRETGKWPHGATIVKEIRGSRKSKLSTGNAHWDGEIVQWFVMVKDTNRTFPDNPSWGRGWGWGLFSINDPKTNISSDYKVDCLGCHVPAKKADWIYTHGYPILWEKLGPFKKYPKELYDAAPSDEKSGK